MHDEAPAHTAKPGQEKAPFDVQKVMEQVHFAFRPQGEAWEGGHSTYAVQVAANGFSMTPYHHPRVQSEGAEAPRRSPEQRGQGVASASREYVEGEPVRIGAARVSRGDLLLPSRRARGQVKDTGGLTLDRGEVAEHFRNSEDGVEQSWSFEQRPGGTGALEVRLPVESGRFVGETANGLHFAAGASGLGVRYGHGTWVDADGHRTPVSARFVAGTIVLSVPAWVVDASTYPAVLDPIVSPEFGMDAPVYGPADRYQYTPAVAYNGTNYLVVWEDSRSNGSDIYGARVSGTGTVLDISGIRISTESSLQYKPVVAHGGENFLVVWYDHRNGYSDIYGARVSGTGTVLDTHGIPISTATDSQSSPAVAHDGTNFLVVWEDYRSGTSYDIYGARVSGTGMVLDTNGIPISTAANEQRYPAVAYNGTNFLVVWQDSRDDHGYGEGCGVYGARVSRTGTVLDTSGIPISTDYNNQERPVVAYNGVDFLVAWQDSRNDKGYDIYGAQVSGTGVVRNPSGIPIFVGDYDQVNPALACMGTNCLVVWRDYSSYDIYGARVNSTGTVLDTGGILISVAASYTEFPAVAHDGTNFLVVWQDYTHANSSNIQGAQVGGSGSVLGTGDISISTSANSQNAPAVAHDGTNFLVVWQDSRNGSSDIYGARVHETGTVLDTSGIPISTYGSYKYAPAVAHDGTNFLVVWEDSRSGSSDIYGARVSSGGTVLDTNGISISTTNNSEYAPAVAHDGTNFLIVWEVYRSETSHDIFGARVSSNGTVLDTDGILISAAAYSQADPVLVHDGTNFLVVWRDERNLVSTNADIYGARVGRDGRVLDTNGIVISSATNSQYDPAVAYNGRYFLVVWEDRRSGADIYGARMRSDGTVLDRSGISIAGSTSIQYTPAVVYDGANFLVVWEDFRGGTGYSDVYGARVSETGTVLDTHGFVISAEPMNEAQPVLASMGGERSLVAYRSSHASASTNSERVMARLILSP
ncbi:hypothetical protein F0U60_28325 [Archangium minus]|uniref:Uncharacterized protein n=1 Tax=Archangium minus TaxID=83450 RepID=A0ABY9WWS2_9BACT|nr:hypothetical protein F0U60_28325 [Archangium minus]